MGIFNRFLGRTDKYNPSGNDGGVDAALWYQKPELIEENRQNRYRQNWQAYYGSRLNVDHGPNKLQQGNREGHTHGKVNYVAVTINRTASFAFGKRWKGVLEFPPIDIDDDDAEEVEIPEEDKQQRAKLAEMLRFCDRVFHRQNGGDSIRLEGALYASVTGDCFMVAFPILPDSLEFGLNDENSPVVKNMNRSKIRVMVVNSAFATPEYSPDGQRIAKFTMEYPIALPGVDENQQARVGVLRQEITATEIKETTLTKDGEMIRQKTMDNPIGEVYAVHIKNYPQPGYYGIDDVFPIVGAVQELNDKISNVSDILDYHAAPTTLVFGARVSTLEKGANKIWSGLPTNARVENLKLEGDLTAMNNFIEQLRDMIKETSGVNEAAMGSDLAISNTSGVALHTRFYSMLTVAEQKWASWGPGVKKLYALLLAWGRNLGQIEYTTEDMERFIEALDIKFESNLPKDELLEIQKNTEMVAGNLKSRVRAIADLGSKDPQSELVQIRREKSMFGDSQPQSSIANAEEDDNEQGSTGRNISGLRAPTEANSNAPTEQN